MDLRAGLQKLKFLGAVAKDAVFPTRCCGCGRLYESAGSRRLRDRLQPDLELFDDYLCGPCIGSIELIRSPFCTHCGRPFESRHGVDHICANCREKPFDFTAARSAGAYSQALKKLICHYKYQFRSEFAVPLARLLWQTLLRYWELNDIDCIMPVPLHRRRMRERGFNQAEILVRQWPRVADEQGIRFDGRKLETGLLLRCRATLSQTGLARHQRAVNLSGAFKLKDSAAVQGRRVLLVDDVLTSGATADACARVLIKAQAASVRVLTLARAV